MGETDRKSMDDVLASIRRIVRAEREGDVASASAGGPYDDEPGGHPDAEEPLLLTPGMRADGAAAEKTVWGAVGDGAATGLDATGPGAPAPDREALRAMLRDLLRDELSGGAAEATVREIVRDELIGGQLGNNISQNVLRMVRAEVARAVQASR